MRHIKKFNYLNEDNSQFKTDDIDVPDGKTDRVEITDLIGKIVIGIRYDDENFVLVCQDQNNDEIYYHFYHENDCCEGAWLDDIIGDLNDLLNYPILKAEEKFSCNDDEYITPKNGTLDDSWTWTFYTLATFNGYVDLRWVGTSNGYYSESISIFKMIPDVNILN